MNQPSSLTQMAEGLNGVGRFERTIHLEHRRASDEAIEQASLGVLEVNEEDERQRRRAKRTQNGRVQRGNLRAAVIAAGGDMLRCEQTGSKFRHGWTGPD